MCGIIGYKGEKGIEIQTLVKNAIFNIQRGNDGIGILYTHGDKWISEKYLYGLEEIYKKTLDKSRTKQTKKIGSFSSSTFNKREYKDKQLEFYKDMRRLMEVRTGFALLHHRKATYGGNDTDNLHPIEVDNSYYVHNGTAMGMESVKKYLELFDGIIFDSQTDTEVIATLYSKLKKRFKGDQDKIHEAFRNMFPNGWGVLLEIDVHGTITAIKDNTRNLWVYTKEGDGIVIVSEPTIYIKSFDKVILLDSGIFEIDEDTEGKDYTELAKKSLKWWRGNKDNFDRKKCEICKVEDKITLSTFHCEEHQYQDDREARCLECYFLNYAKIEDEDELAELVAEKESYRQFLGGTT